MRFLLAAAALAASPPAPVLSHDAREAHPFTSASGSGAAVAYVRDTRRWRQFWLYSPENMQDRGIVRTGRHAGDWELVMIRRDGREAVLSQHSGAERCAIAPGRPLTVHVAHGSHALYFRRGTRDRTWPDPNDEALGGGLRVVPVLEPLDEQAWADSPRRWGDARASWIPGEMDSPRGPRFQGVRWQDPDAFAANARSCTGDRCDRRGDCDGRENAVAGIFAALAASLLLTRVFKRG